MAAAVVVAARTAASVDHDAVTLSSCSAKSEKIKGEPDVDALLLSIAGIDC
jgi:hypothetical protein